MDGMTTLTTPRFGWTDACHQGIKLKNVNFGNGKVLQDLHYDRGLNVVVHSTERIVLQRNATGVNKAYAWEEGVALGQLQQIAWIKNKVTDTFMWVRIDDYGNVEGSENNKAWQWINGDWQYVDFRL